MTAAVSATDEARALVDRLTAVLAPLERASSEAWWVSNTVATPEAEARRVELERALSDTYADPEAYTELTRFAAAAIDDPLVARSVEVLRLAYAGEQLPASLRAEMVQLSAECDTLYATFRGEAAGRRWSDNDIERVLVESDDTTLRQAAWEASKQVGAAVAPRVLRLVELRNAAARQLGYPHYYAMALALGELSEQRLFAVLDELDAASAEPFAAMKADLDVRLSARFGVPAAELGPWHLADPFFQEAPHEAVPALDLDPLLVDQDLVALTLSTYDELGIPLRSVVDRSDLVTRDGKNQHAFCICIDRERDVRVLANVVPGERWASTMLHEFGHAAYDMNIALDLPWTLREAAHSLTTEAVAQLYGRLSKDAAWLRDVAGVDPAAVEDVDAVAHAILRAHMLVFARWVLVMCHFERGLYADPTADHDARWWDLVERYQLVRRPTGRHAPDWAAKLHLALSPVYYQNYVLGECLASQLAATVRDRGGRLHGDANTGRWLADEFFGPGASLRWDALVERATGRPLAADDFVAQFCR